MRSSKLTHAEYGTGSHRTATCYMQYSVASSRRPWQIRVTLKDHQSLDLVGQGAMSEAYETAAIRISAPACCARAYARRTLVRRALVCWMAWPLHGARCTVQLVSMLMRCALCCCTLLDGHDR